MMQYLCTLYTPEITHKLVAIHIAYNHIILLTLSQLCKQYMHHTVSVIIHNFAGIQLQYLADLSRLNSIHHQLSCNKPLIAHNTQFAPF